MADFDLHALAAPIEKLKGDLYQAYKELDAKWEAVAATLRSLSIPSDVACMFWSADDGTEHHSCLEWRKWKGSRRLCIVHYVWYHEDDGVDVVPYEEWSGQQRLSLLTHVPALFSRAEKITQEFIQQVREQEAK